MLANNIQSPSHCCCLSAVRAPHVLGLVVQLTKANIKNLKIASRPCRSLCRDLLQLLLLVLLLLLLMPEETEKQIKAGKVPESNRTATKRTDITLGPLNQQKTEHQFKPATAGVRPACVPGGLPEPRWPFLP